METIFNLRQEFIKNEPIGKKKPAIRIAVQLDENNLENNVISFKDLFHINTYKQNRNKKRCKESSENTESEGELRSDILSSYSDSEDSTEKTEPEDNTTEEDILSIETKTNSFNNSLLNEEINELMKSNQPVDIKKAINLRDMIAKESFQKLEMDILKKKKRKFYEYYDMNDPFIDDSEDYIIENSTKVTRNNEQNFVICQENMEMKTKEKLIKADKQSSMILNQKIMIIMKKIKNQQYYTH